MKTLDTKAWSSFRGWQLLYAYCYTLDEEELMVPMISQGGLRFCIWKTPRPCPMPLFP